MTEIQGKKFMPREVSSSIEIQASTEDVKYAILGLMRDEPVEQQGNHIIIKPRKRLHFFAFIPTIDMLYKTIDLQIDAQNATSSMMHYRFEGRAILATKILLIIYTVFFGGILALLLALLRFSSDKEIFSLYFFLVLFMIAIIALSVGSLAWRYSKKQQNKNFKKVFLKELIPYIKRVQQKRNQ